MGVSTRLLDALAEGYGHLPLVDFLIEPLLLLGEISVKFGLSWHRSLYRLLLLDRLKTVSYHLSELMS